MGLGGVGAERGGTGRGGAGRNGTGRCGAGRGGKGTGRGVAWRAREACKKKVSVLCTYRVTTVLLVLLEHLVPLELKESRE